MMMQNKTAPTMSPSAPMIKGSSGPRPLSSNASPISMIGVDSTNIQNWKGDAVTIKKDTVAPQVTIKSPVKGKTYALKERVLASYSCLDATSGVATCLGTVKKGAVINTSSKGTKTFTVIGTDNAGNKTTQVLLYAVK